MAIDKIILGTSNPHKAEKLKWIFNSYFSDIIQQDKNIDIEENGATFKENAEIKAIAISKLYGSYSGATDGGVLIPALGDNWNAVLTKRFIGREDVTDFDRMDALLKLMKGRMGDDRAITWNEAIAFAYNGELLFSHQVEGDRGLLQTSYNPDQYKPGIWQCTLTCYPQFDGRNFFELNEEELKYSEISWFRLKDAIDDYMKNSKTTT
jgi:XTP/dITP diphosphohydrolase